MNKKSKAGLLAGTSLCAALALSGVTAYGAANVTVNGNNLLINSNTISTNLDSAPGVGTSTSSGIGFGAITINMANTINTISSTDFVRVDDNRGQNAGWNVTVSATDFTATGITDLSLPTGTGTLDVAIPASSMLTVTPQTPTALFATDASNVTAQNIAGVPVTETGVKVLSSARGYGQGVYKQQLNYTITLPNYLPSDAEITASSSDSEFTATNRTAGAKIGLFAGIYTSTVSYNITTGP